ncbi:MAG: threonine synthase, partial [Acidobacteria bacterium]|nr:threonine synthase [Acidobacteriota bacterium]
PTGNFGNIYAGLVAQRMGLPLRFVLATNENDVLAEFFATGRYRIRANDEVAATSSPSMDIAKASNFERLVHDAVGDATTLAKLWRRLGSAGSFDLGGTPAWDRIRERHIAAGSSTHADRLATIADVHNRYGRIIDPHTADGVKVGRELADPSLPLVCLETAQPTKFEATIREALGHVPARPGHLVGLENRTQVVDVVPAAPDVVRERIESFTTSWRP